MKSKVPLTSSQRAKLANQVSFDAVCAELAELGVSRYVVKELVKLGRLHIYGHGRTVLRHDLDACKAWLSERIEGDPKWLDRYGKRARIMGGGARQVVSGTSARPVRVVSIADTPITSVAREVRHAPASPNMTVRTLGDAPRPAPARVVERGRR